MRHTLHGKARSRVTLVGGGDALRATQACAEETHATRQITGDQSGRGTCRPPGGRHAWVCRTLGCRLSYVAKHMSPKKETTTREGSMRATCLPLPLPLPSHNPLVRASPEEDGLLTSSHILGGAEVAGVRSYTDTPQRGPSQCVL